MQTYQEIPKRTRNGIEARFNAIINKYGVEPTRLIANRFFNSIRERRKLEKEIADKEKELSELKNKK